MRNFRKNISGFEQKHKSSQKKFALRKIFSHFVETLDNIDFYIMIHLRQITRKYEF